jgi:hypothetical protein
LTLENFSMLVRFRSCNLTLQLIMPCLIRIVCRESFPVSTQRQRSNLVLLVAINLNLWVSPIKYCACSRTLLSMKRGNPSCCRYTRCSNWTLTPPVSIFFPPKGFTVS